MQAATRTAQHGAVGAAQRQSAEYAVAMARRRPLTPQQLAESAEATRRGPDGKPLRDTMRTMIEGTVTAPEPASLPRQPLPRKGHR